MNILQEVCAIATAPCVEPRVMRYVEQFARERRGLRVTRDRWGNRQLELPGRSGGRAPRLVLVAHADHPGFVARRMRDARTLVADFRGGVLADYVRGARVRFFDGVREIRGQVTAIERRKSRDAAFVLLDQASLVRSRNHHRVLRRELERVRALIEAVPGDVDPILSALLENPDGHGD